MLQQGLTTYTNMMRLLSMKDIKGLKCYISWTCLKFSTHAQPFVSRNVWNNVIYSFIFEVQNSRKTCPCISKESPCLTFTHISSPKSTLGQFFLYFCLKLNMSQTYPCIDLCFWKSLSQKFNKFFIVRLL